MKTFEVAYQDAVLTVDLPGLPKNINVRIIKAIEERLMTEPARYGRRLGKSLTGLWKIRVGDYRVAYELKGRVVEIWHVGHRKNIYREAARRWARRK